VAVDGKTVRGTRHAAADGQGLHLLAAADPQAGAVLAQAQVDGKTNEITCFEPLLEPLDLAGAVVTADALHAQREHAQFLATKKNAHYILAVKINQPSLKAALTPNPFGSPSQRAVRQGIRPLRHQGAVDADPGDRPDLLLHPRRSHRQADPGQGTALQQVAPSSSGEDAQPRLTLSTAAPTNRTPRAKP